MLATQSRRRFTTRVALVGAAGLLGCAAAGATKSSPARIIAAGTDWRFYDELKRELKT
jgi:hypothetical protein